MTAGLLAQAIQMPESLKEISLVDWGRFLIWILGLAILGGIWWEDKNYESEELSSRVNAQAELFSSKMTALSNRITSLETKQTTLISDVGDVKGDLRVMVKDLSFFSQSIQDRWEEEKHQIEILQASQRQLAEQVTKRFEDVSASLADNRIWMIQSIQESLGQNQVDGQNRNNRR